jgi:hypothetical protein
MKKERPPWLRAKPVFLFWLTTWVSLFLLGAAISQGYRYPDASPHRDFVYFLMFLILPLFACIGLAHFFACILTPKIAIRSAIVGFLSGFLGIAVLHILIQNSSDPVAVMAYLGMIFYYAAFAISGFILSALIQFILSKIKNKNHA